MSYPNAPSYPSRIGAPWLRLSQQEIADFLIRHPEVETQSEPVMRMLAWLEQEFRMTSDAR